MHEFGIADEILEEAKRVAEANGGGRITRIEVRLGERGGASKDELEFAFRHLQEDHGCGDIEFLVEVVLARWTCTSCGRECSEEELLCPACGGAAALTEGGDIVLQRVTLES